MRKLLITGANGFLGYYLVKLLKDKGYSILATGKGGCRLPFSSDLLQYRSMDLCTQQDVNAVVSDFKPDIIIHSGAMSKPDECEKNKDAAWQTNVMGTEYLLQSALPFKSHFVFISTDFVFDGKKGFYNETDKPSPINYYGKTKLQAEEAVKKYPAPWSIVRTVMVYGRPWLNRQNLVSSCVTALQKHEQLTIYEDQIRTPTYVEDLAHGIGLIIEKSATGIFHLSGKEEMSLHEMIVRTARHFHFDESLITPITEKDRYQAAQRPFKTGFNISKARSELGYEPLDFISGLERTFSGT